MRHDRFAALSFWFFLAGLVAVSLGPAPISAAITSSIEPAELRLAEAGAATPTIDADAVVALDTVTKTGWNLRALGTSRSVWTVALRYTQCDALGVHSDRAPPLA